MMARLAMAFLCVATGAVLAGPVDGPSSFRLQVPSTKGEQVGEAEFVREFRGGQRACVIVVGDHDPVVELEVRVYETEKDSTAEGKLVARDGGGKDVLGAVWVPARTGPYRIVILNPSPFGPKNPYNRCYIAVK